jgi:hypothetical protein
MRHVVAANSYARTDPAILARQKVLLPPELAMGFELRIVEYRKMFRQFTWNMRPSRRAT